MGDLAHERGAVVVDARREALKVGHDTVAREVELAEGRRAIARDRGGAAEHGHADAAPGLLLVVELVALARHGVLGVGGRVTGADDAVADRQMLDLEGLEEGVIRGHRGRLRTDGRGAHSYTITREQTIPRPRSGEPANAATGQRPAWRLMTRPRTWNARAMRRRRAPIILAAATATLLAAAARAEAPPDAGRIAALFEAAAFGGAAPDAKLRKWRVPIRIKVVGEGSDPFRGAIAGHADALSALTGLDIAISPSAQVNRNMVVWFTRKRSLLHAGQRFEPDRDRLAAIVAAAADGCYSLTYQWDDGGIIFAAVIVDTEREPAEIEHCLLEEMTESLGLSKAGAGFSPSIFDSRARLPALSPIDEVLVRTLYDPRLSPGMTRGEALARAREIIAELARIIHGSA
jgi:hypothetical protein